MTTLITNEYNSGTSSTRKRCRFGGVFVTCDTGGFLLWTSPVRPVARVLLREYFCLYLSLVFYDVKYFYYEYYTFLVLSFEYTCLCRCGVSVVACGTGGCLCDNPRGAGGYQIVTMTTLFPVFDKSSTSLRRNCCRFGGVFVAGCTGNCHAGNFHCGRLRKLRRNGVFIGFSFLGITSELLMSSHIDSLIIKPHSIIVLRYYLVFYFTLFYFHVFHVKYCSYEHYS